MGHFAADAAGTRLSPRVPRPRTPGQARTGSTDGPRRVKIVVVGLDEVGLRLAVRAAEVDHAVVGHETDRRRLQALAVGRSYVDGVSETRLRALAPEEFRVSAEESALADFDIAVIAGSASIAAAAQAVARYLLPGRAVVLAPGVAAPGGEDAVAEVLEAGSGLTPGIDFHLGALAGSSGPRTTPAGRVAVAAFRRRLAEPPASAAVRPPS
ncbi:MAG: hypothetical protein ACTHNS_13010 [Marmoricola sp.]